MNLADLERILRQGAASLAEGSRLYAGAAAIAPGSLAASLVLYAGRGLINAGFVAHAEAHGEARTDILAVHPPTGALVIAEVRRLDGHGGTGGALFDRARLATFEPPGGAATQPPIRVGARYGLLVGLSANREYARWFTTMPSGAIAPTAELAALQEQLPSDAVWNGYALSDAVEAAGQRRTEWLLYAAFQVR